MREALGHKIFTVEDLMDELRKYPPNYEVGFNAGGTTAFSLAAVKDYGNPEVGIVDLYLKVSYDSTYGIVPASPDME